MGGEEQGQACWILQFLWVLLEGKTVLWNPVTKAGSKFVNNCKGPQTFWVEMGQWCEGTHKLEIKGKDMLRITLIKFTFLSHVFLIWQIYYCIFIVCSFVCFIWTKSDFVSVKLVSDINSKIPIAAMFVDVGLEETYRTQCAGMDVTTPNTKFQVDCVWNVMSYAPKPDFVFRRNGRVHLNRRGRQFSRLLAAEVCASAVVMLDTPCSEVVWRVLATHCIRQFPLHFPSGASSCAITFQLDST